jgi:hypothetical protein
MNIDAQRGAHRSRNNHENSTVFLGVSVKHRLKIGNLPSYRHAGDHKLLAPAQVGLNEDANAKGPLGHCKQAQGGADTRFEIESAHTRSPTTLPSATSPPFALLLLRPLQGLFTMRSHAGMLAKGYLGSWNEPRRHNITPRPITFYELENIPFRVAKENEPTTGDVLIELPPATDREDADDPLNGAGELLVN